MAKLHTGRFEVASLRRSWIDLAADILDTSLLAVTNRATVSTSTPARTW